MKKQGFTLAEALITLAIIGVAAALISPALRNLIPNQEKMEFMECYKILTNSLPLIEYAPKKEQYEFVNGKIYPTCMGLACVRDIGEKISEISGVSNYTWSAGNSDLSEGKNLNNGITIYQTWQEITCTNKKSGNNFTFTLKGNGTIKELDEKGQKFMKDQFNYYKKGNEDEDE